MRPGSAMTTAAEDFESEFPSPYLKAMVMRLRIEMFSAASALQGDLADEFWKLVDDLNTMRSKRTICAPKSDG
jgi:hypothetical protein